MTIAVIMKLILARLFRRILSSLMSSEENERVGTFLSQAHTACLMQYWKVRSLTMTVKSENMTQCTMAQVLKEFGIRDFAKNDYLCPHFLVYQLFQISNI